MKKISENFSLFWKANAGKMSFIVLFLLFTGIIISQRETLALLERMEERNFQGSGTHLPESVIVSDWRDYYGGSMGFDNIVSQGGQTIRISTGVNGDWYGARGDIKNPLDLTDKSIRFMVRFDDFNSVRTFMILFATDGGMFDNYFSFNIKNYFADPAPNEWHEIIIDKSDFLVAEGNPDWKNVTDVGIRVVADERTYTRVWFEGLATVKNTFEPMISLTFDDGFKSNVAAADIMKEYGFTGTAYVIPSYFGMEGYVSQTDVDYLHGLGWDISGHGHTNLRLYSLGDAEGELAVMRAYLDSHNYKGKEHFSYPNGGHTESLRSLVAEYFETARTIDGLSQPQGYLIPTKINAKTVSVIHNVDHIKNWIDDAVRDKSWLILTWHDLVATPANDTEYSMESFREIVRYLDEINVEVMPFSEAYSRLR